MSDKKAVCVPVTRAERTSWAMSNVLVPAHMVTMSTEVDATSLEQLREGFRRIGGQPPSYTAIVLKAAAMTMKRNPQANRAILGFPFFKRLYQFGNTDISVAVEKGLPALPGQAYAQPIRNAFEKSLQDISSELSALAHCDETNNDNYRLFMTILRRVPRPFSLWLINAPHRAPRLWAQYRGCACWVNAPSKAGADFVATTWPWPITFSFGVVKPRPIVIGDRLEVRKTMPLVMIFDRRIMGGGPASRLFSQCAAILEKELAEQERGRSGLPPE